MDRNVFDKYRFNSSTRDSIVRPVGMDILEDGTKVIHLGAVHGAPVSLPVLSRRTPQKRPALSLKPVVKVSRKRRRADLTKNQKREVFFLFYSDARNATGVDKGYPCVICRENLMYLDGTGSWNASHIRPIRHCPVRDPKYALPTCTACNGKMGVNKQNHLNAFDMMIRYNYRARIYPIAKVLHQRYDKNGLSVLQFVFQSYGRGSINQDGHMDKTLIIRTNSVYEEIALREAEDLEEKRQRAVEKKSSEIQDIHEQIRALLLEVERVRTQERGAIMRMYKDLDIYKGVKQMVFDNCGLFH
jgi:hypothetical protein